ncbi:DUF6090 family protein [Robiginitalea sp. IMCC44478]|uniref:DUF6090 family protein n=1 Tax=Robiginitalea sp. IMCC44478 TaxID=3459122 RepID=UPI0040427520
MIKFFHKIRQGLLFENKLSRYLLYAIGEIILVVIGILIALQINNANEAEKQDVVEEAYLKRMLIDLEKDHELWIKTIDQKKAQLNAIDRIQQIAAEERDSLLAIMDYLFTAFTWADLNTHQSTFTEMLSSGNLNLIKNDSIKIRLLELNEGYQSESSRQNTFKIEYTNTMEAFRENVLFTDIRKLYQNGASLNQDEREGLSIRVRRDLAALTSDKKFLNNLIGLAYNYGNQLQSMGTLRTRTEELRDLIQREIDAE